MTARELIQRQLVSLPKPTAEEADAALRAMNRMLDRWNTRPRGPALMVEPPSVQEIEEQYGCGTLAQPIGFDWYTEAAEIARIKLWPDPGL